MIIYDSNSLFFPKYLKGYRKLPLIGKMFINLSDGRTLYGIMREPDLFVPLLPFEIHGILVNKDEIVTLELITGYYPNAFCHQFKRKI